MGRCHSINKVSPKRRRRACTSPCVFLSGGGREGEEGALGCAASGSAAEEMCVALRWGRHGGLLRAPAGNVKQVRLCRRRVHSQPVSAAMEVTETPAQDRCTRVHDRCLRVLLRVGSALAWIYVLRSSPASVRGGVVFWGGGKDVRPFVLLLFKAQRFLASFFFKFKWQCCNVRR